MAKTYTAFSRNIGPDLQKLVKSDVSIGVVTLKVDLTLEDAGYKKVTGSPVWLQKVNDTANKIVPKAITDIAAEITKTKGLDGKKLEAIISKAGEAAADDLADAVEKALETWVKDKKEYTSYKVKSAGKIILGVVGVASSVAAIGASMGAASPVAIISLVRSCIGLAQDVAKVALEAKSIEKLIRVDVVVLTKAFAKNKDNKALQNVKEVALAGIAVILGVDTPTINNCAGRIELYHNKITGLKKDHEKFAGAIYKVMDLQDSLKDKMAKAGKDLKSFDKLKKSLEAAEKTLDGILKDVTHIGERIEKGEKRYDFYKGYIEALKGGVSSWTKYAQTALGLAFDLGTGVGTAAGGIEKGLEALKDIMMATNEVLLEKV